MKKVLAVLCATALTVCCLFMFACSAAGTYKFESLTIDILGVKTEIKAGEEYMGSTINADYVVLELNKDKTASLKAGATQAQAGTWEEKDGQVILSVEGQEYARATKDGKKLIVEMAGIKYVLSK